MSTLQIRKLESGAFKHVDSIDGDFFLGRFNFKQEFNKAFLVEAYGAKRREYYISDITVYNYLGTVEIFTNWTDLFNRLTDLGYNGIETNGIIPAGAYLSDNPSDYTNATLPLSDTDNLLVNQGGVWKIVDKSEVSNAFTPEILITNPAVTGTYNIDWSAGDVWNLTLTGNTTLTESNLPASGITKTINLQIVGNYTLAYPTDWTDFITGSFIGSATLNTLTCQYFGATKYKVQIVQPD